MTIFTMDLRLHSRNFIGFLAILIVAILRPTSCRREDNSSNHLKQFDHGIMVKCFRKCQFFRGGHSSTGEEGSLTLYDKCNLQCVHRERKKVLKRFKVPAKNFIVLGPDDKTPKRLRIPAKLPQLPKQLHDKVNPRSWPKGNCSSFGIGKVDPSLKDVVVLNDVTITCKNGNKVEISWKKPKDFSSCTGYQVNYRIDGLKGAANKYCYELEKLETSLTINLDHTSKEIHLAVTALPLPYKCDIILKKYDICTGEDAKKRSRRDINPTPSFVILKSGDPIPTDLVMPSVIPPFPFPTDPFGTKRPDSNCLPPQTGITSDKYAGLAKVTNVLCMKAGNFSKKSFIIQWEPPKDYQNIPYTHFQVYFSITPDNVIPDPTKIGCQQVDKNTFSYRVENVDRTDTIHVAVVPFPTYDKLEEKLATFIPCAETPTKIPTRIEGPDADTDTKPRVNVIIGSTIALLVAVAVLAILFTYHRGLLPCGGDGGTLPPESQSDIIYVSYYPDTKKYESNLLNLVAKLRRVYGLNLIMDSYCQTQVAELGIARWCQKQLSESTRILMVVSREYLKICNEWKNGSTEMLESHDTNVSRVCSELQFVVDKIFERRKNVLLTIILADVKPGELPDFLRGMKTFSWPKTGDDEHSVVCNIYTTEEIAVM